MLLCLPLQLVGVGRLRLRVPQLPVQCIPLPTTAPSRRLSIFKRPKLDIDEAQLQIEMSGRARILAARRRWRLLVKTHDHDRDQRRLQAPLLRKTAHISTDQDLGARERQAPHACELWPNSKEKAL